MSRFGYRAVYDSGGAYSANTELLGGAGREDLHTVISKNRGVSERGGLGV